MPLEDQDQQNTVSLEQAEAQFHIRQITADITKYYYVVSSLDQEAAGRIINYIHQSPFDKKYEGIKKLLNNTFGLSRRARAAKLLHMDGLGDCKPSVLMNEMLALLDGHQPCLLFEQIFLEQMPDNIRFIITDDNFTNPQQLAARADVLWQAKQQGEASITNAITQRVS